MRRNTTGLGVLLQGPFEWEADEKTGAGGWLTPYLAAMFENRLAAECETQTEPVLLARRDERLK